MESNVQRAARALIEHFKTQKRAAEEVGVEQPTLSGWLRGEYRASAKNALRAERVTGGAVKAVDLCPDLKPKDTAA